jgi:hypothetical protein
MQTTQTACLWSSLLLSIEQCNICMDTLSVSPPSSRHPRTAVCEQHLRQQVCPPPVFATLWYDNGLGIGSLATSPLRQPQRDSCEPHSRQNVFRTHPVLGIERSYICMETYFMATSSLRRRQSAVCKTHSRQHVCAPSLIARYCVVRRWSLKEFVGNTLIKANSTA